MSWSRRFIDELSEQVGYPVWLLRSYVVGGAPGREIALASAPGYGDACVIAADGVRVDGATLNTSTWGVTLGSFSIDVVETDDLYDNMTRGTPVRLFLGWAGWTEADFEPVAIGMVRNFRRRGQSPIVTIECNDIFTAIASRFSSTRTALPLFYLAGTATTLSTAYAAGDGTVTVASTADIEQEDSAYGAVLVAPTTGAPFYLYWSAATATVLTLFEAGTDHLATTRTAAAVADVVTGCAFLRGDPDEIVRKMLVSTGGTGGGAWDLLPASWSWGLPDAWVDHDDLDAWADRVMVLSSGTYRLEIVQTEPVDDGYAWLAEKLRRLGLFLAVRQGQITMRAGLSWTSSATYKSGLTLTDADIIEVIEWESHDSTATEYCRVDVLTQAHNGTEATYSGAEEGPATLPATQSREFDLVGIVWQNLTNISDDVHTRLGMGALRIPEAFRVRVTLPFAQLCVGDVLDLDVATKLRSRLTSGGTYEGMAGVVTEVTPDWTGRSCVIRVRVFAGDGEAFPS